jgi:hypothetical protein
MQAKGFNEFGDGNYLLKSWLGIGKKGSANLKTARGFFVCPDDYLSRSSKLPRIVLSISTVELFEMMCPEVFSEVQPLSGWFKDYDRLDFAKFKSDAKLAYLFAVAYFLTNVPKGTYKSLKDFFGEEISASIRANMKDYIPGFSRMAHNSRVFLTRRAMFEYAKGIILDRLRDPDTSGILTNLGAFTKCMACNVYSHVLGDGFEEYCLARMHNLEKAEACELQLKLAKATGSDGVIIRLDTCRAFRSYSARLTGIRIPDLLYVTSNRIYPIDMKANLIFAKPFQVSRENLAALLVAAKSVISVLFSGMTIDGNQY